LLPIAKHPMLLRLADFFKASRMQRYRAKHWCADDNEWKFLRRDCIFGGWGVWGYKCDGWETLRDKGIRIQQ